MNIFYNDKTDLLYVRFDDEKHEIVNKRVSDDIVVDIAENGKIIGIEIMNASKVVPLENVLPLRFENVK
ncbi:MAG: DUF2283 domain-containing protein [Elusimicrobiota bacterium]|nr:DUF2283 domain-containing protein [Elusimicrobiota bacterium]